VRLLVGTDDGLYRADSSPFESDDADRILDCGRVTQVADLDHANGVFGGHATAPTDRQTAATPGSRSTCRR
jgi:hypothetical protein